MIGAEDSFFLVEILLRNLKNVCKESNYIQYDNSQACIIVKFRVKG